MLADVPFSTQKRTGGLAMCLLAHFDAKWQQRARTALIIYGYLD